MSSIPQSFLHDVWIRKTLGLAGYSCLVYDHILTFDKEVEFIWRGPWTVAKVIFLINRYGNLLGQTYIQVLDTGWIVHGRSAPRICQVFNLFTALFMFFSSESVHIIVLLRAWAIWGCRRRVAAALVASYILYLMFTVIMTGFGTNSPTFHEFQYLDVIGICVGVVPRFIWLLPVANFVLDTAVFGTTIRSLWQHSKDCRRLYPSPLLCLLFRDAVLFYIMSTFFDAFTVLSWTAYASSPKYVLCLTLALNLLCIAGQRLVLNIRGLTARSYSPRSLSAEVDRQIERINDAGPDWWVSNDKFDSTDGMAYESGSLLHETRGQDMEMMVMVRRGNGDAFPGECKPTMDADGLPRRTAWAAGVASRELEVELEVVTEILRPPDETHVPIGRSRA